MERWTLDTSTNAALSLDAGAALRSPTRLGADGDYSSTDCLCAALASIVILSLVLLPSRAIAVRPSLVLTVNTNNTQCLRRGPAQAPPLRLWNARPRARCIPRVPCFCARREGSSDGNSLQTGALTAPTPPAQRHAFYIVAPPTRGRQRGRETSQCPV